MLRFRRPARSYDLHQHLTVLFVCAVATVVFTRGFLAATGYPQVGGAKLHIAHVLWGGLLMLAGLLTTLAFLSPAAKPVASVLGGVGFGLFIDEVGKFVTKDVDYFYKPAIAIIYVCFVLLFGLIRWLSRSNFSAEEATLIGLDALERAAVGALSPERRARVLALLASTGAAAGPAAPTPGVRPGSDTVSGLSRESHGTVSGSMAAETGLERREGRNAEGGRAPGVRPGSDPGGEARVALAGTVRELLERSAAEPAGHPPLSHRVSAALAAVWVPLTEHRLFRAGIFAALAVAAGVSAAEAGWLLRNGVSGLSFSQKAFTVTTIAADVALLVGALRLRRSLASALHWYDHAVLLEITVGQIFLYNSEQLAATLNLVALLIIWGLLRWTIQFEAGRAAAATPGPRVRAAG